MNHIWLHQNKADKLILFFNGWGCDQYQFQHMQSDNYDVLMLNDYRSLYLPESFWEALESYKEINVVAWSFGVWVAQCVMEEWGDRVYEAVAINGTTEPVSACFGIPKPIVMATLSNLSERNLEKFQRRMVKSSDLWARFEPVKPQRDLDEVENELFLLTEHFKVQKFKKNAFNKVIIGNDDLIMPTVNQKAFWQGKAELIDLDQPHFCFFAFHKWDDIITRSQA